MIYLKSYKLFENISINKRVVLTGAPGTGKSVVIDRLKEMGYNIIPETARELIEYFKKYEPEHLPWNDRNYFQKVVGDKVVDYYIKNKSGFFDRSIVDEIGFLNYYNLEVPKDVTNKCLEYRYDKIFIFKPWKKIFRNDSVRGETFEDCLGLDKCLTEAYFDFGYKPIEVINGNIDERVDFILDNI